MEPLAFVEVMGRHDDVQSRWPVYRWPAQAGRGYEADVILDDRFVAPQHLRIEPAADGRFTVRDLDSVNGISIQPSRRRVALAEVGPDDIVCLGQTRIRIRTRSHGVPRETPLRATSFYRRPLAFMVAAALLLGITVWSAWLTTTGPEDMGLLVFPVVAVFAGTGIWVSIWSLVSRTVGGYANFTAHGFVACAGLTVLALSGVLLDYLSFAINVRWLGRLGLAAAAAIFAYMLYRHLRLNSRAARSRVAAAAVAVSLVIYGAIHGIEVAGESAREGMQRYDETLKPPAFLWVRGVTPEAFLAGGEQLKHRVDAAARATTN